MIYTKIIIKMKTKLLLIILFTTVIIDISPVFSQDEELADKAASKADLSYFSQEEMQFILGDKNQPWNYGRISIAPYYEIGIGKFAVVLPYTTGFMIAFDHGIHHAFKPVYRRKSPFIPGLRVELAFNLFGPLSVNSLSITGGLLWLFPIADGKGGEITLSSTAGMNFMRGQIGNSYFTNDALYLTGALGYQLSFSKIFFSLDGRFSFINDKNYPWYGVGGSLGIGYKFSQLSGSEPNEGSSK